MVADQHDGASEHSDADASTDIHYQQGVTAVEHRHIDAAGDNHPFGEQAQAFEADMRTLIRKVADDLYQSWEATIREYLANAETACLKVQEYLDNPAASPYDEMLVDDSYQPKIEVTWDQQEDLLTIADNGIGMAADEVDQIFRQIGHSAARDDGTKSGQFGMGALSFVKFVGLDNAMLMTSHSRLNDDNAGYYVTLAGVEPIRGSLPEGQYGTSFQLTPNGDYDVREAVETYAKWLRVPLRYEEIGRDGTVAFQEDYGDRKLYDDYDDDRICLAFEQEGAFKAYATEREYNADPRTLLLSMEIDRNDGDSPQRHGSPFPFDVRLLDESGKVIESTNGNTGLMPVPDSDYEQMLLNARAGYITDDLLRSKDVVGQEVLDGPHAGQIVVDDAVYNDGTPLPAGNEYLPRSEVASDDEPGEATVIFGPNEGRTVVDEATWDDMEQGRAANYVPESELEPYDVETGEGDLRLPQPTSDRDRLQEHETFWKYLGDHFAGQLEETAHELFEVIQESENPVQEIVDLDEDDLVVSVGQPA